LSVKHILEMVVEVHVLLFHVSHGLSVGSGECPSSVPLSVSCPVSSCQLVGRYQSVLPVIICDPITAGIRTEGWSWSW
jgi:hypothetical protein